MQTRSRIKIDSEILKNMIPLQDDRCKSPKVLAITRKISANEISKNNVEESDISQKPHELHIGECSTLQVIKNIRELQFNIFKTDIKNKNGSKEGTIQ